METHLINFFALLIIRLYFFGHFRSTDDCVHTCQNLLNWKCITCIHLWHFLIILIKIGIYIKDKCHVYLCTYAKTSLNLMKKCRFTDFFCVCIGFVMAPKSRYLISVNHKIVMWNTNRPRRLYFTIFLNLLFPYFPIFSLNGVCCHFFSADTFSVFMYNFIHFHVIYIY